MIIALFAWFHSLFTRRPAPAAQPAVQPAPVPHFPDPVMRAEIRRLTRKNRNQALRIRHLAAWHTAHQERTDALLSEIHDLTARIGDNYWTRLRDLLDGEGMLPQSTGQTAS